MKKHCKSPLGGLLAGVALLAAQAQASGAQLAFSANFDSAPSGAAANTFAPAGLGFYPAVRQPDVDQLGSEVPGTEKWRVDLSAPSVTLDNPLSFGRGQAPSGANALNSVFQPTLVAFDQASSFSNFSVTLDNDTFGSSAATIEFYGAQDNLLLSLTIDQTKAGLEVNSGPLEGVSKVVLPAGAFYDNVSAVPEPGTFALIGLGAGALALAARRRSRR